MSGWKGASERLARHSTRTGHPSKCSSATTAPPIGPRTSSRPGLRTSRACDTCGCLATPETRQPPATWARKAREGSGSHSWTTMTSGFPASSGSRVRRSRPGAMTSWPRTRCAPAAVPTFGLTSEVVPDRAEFLRHNPIITSTAVAAPVHPDRGGGFRRFGYRDFDQGRGLRGLAQPGLPWSQLPRPAGRAGRLRGRSGEPAQRCRRPAGGRGRRGALAAVAASAGRSRGPARFPARDGDGSASSAARRLGQNGNQVSLQTTVLWEANSLALVGIDRPNIRPEAGSSGLQAGRFSITDRSSSRSNLRPNGLPLSTIAGSARSEVSWDESCEVARS